MTSRHRNNDRVSGAGFATLVLGFFLHIAAPARAAQTDIHGPTTGPVVSSQFGASVTVLPNGNIVVTDPNATVSGVAAAGAVYLYTPGGTLISTLTGSQANDTVGTRVLVVGSGNFIVVSENWAAGAASAAGAVTWVSGSAGLNGSVSPVNSLVGSSKNDLVGYPSVVVFSNGNYVVGSPNWNNGLTTDAGAATWGDGNVGVKGPISAGNSLVGTTASSAVGYNVTALSNGNYVVVSPYWNTGVASLGLGAVTWGDGSSSAGGVKGVVSTGNSLVGTTADDMVGYSGVYALTNGNYVVTSEFRQNSGNNDAGAATWCNGATGLPRGTVTSINSLVGTSANDQVGRGLTVLSNGNYVVVSPDWHNGGISVGATTWGDGSTASGGVKGMVSSANSLVGTTKGDGIGASGVVPLSNGNYVVASAGWTNSGVAVAGAATWANGSNGQPTGAVSPNNSLVGSTMEDGDGLAVTALSNGNYVVAYNAWNNGPAAAVGAATWGDGSTAGGGVNGVVSSANSLTGTTAGDSISYPAVVALSNGKYVVPGSAWTNASASATSAGAATWASGSAALSATVSTSNSLVGMSTNDQVSDPGITALTNGNYVVASRLWNGPVTNAGAASWVNGSNAHAGTISPFNSLVGATALDQVGENGVAAMTDGNYVVSSPSWNNSAIGQAGAITLASGSYRLAGHIAAWNSVLGGVAGGGQNMVYTYDATRHTLVVGRPGENIVSLFTVDQIFADNFEP